MSENAMGEEKRDGDAENDYVLSNHKGLLEHWK